MCVVKKFAYCKTMIVKFIPDFNVRHILFLPPDNVQEYLYLKKKNRFTNFSYTQMTICTLRDGDGKTITVEVAYSDVMCTNPVNYPLDVHLVCHRFLNTPKKNLSLHCNNIICDHISL